MPESTVKGTRQGEVTARYRRFLESLSADQRRAAAAFLEANNFSADFTLQPWPAVVSRRELASFADTAIRLARLVRDLPRRVFKNRAAKLAEFYAFEDEIAATLAMAPPNGIEHAPYRGDFILTENGLKMIELNGGTGLAGWIVSLYRDLYQRSPATSWLLEAGLELSDANTTRQLCRHFVERMAATPAFADEPSWNVVITHAHNYSATFSPTTERLCGEEYAAALDQAACSRSGRLRFCRYPELECRDGRVYFEGARIHTLFEFGLDDDETIRKEVYRSFKTGHLLLYTGPAGITVTDKRNLAILSQNQDSALFSPEEQELIAAAVPWTRLLKERSTDWRGQQVTLPDFVLARQEEMVLKRGFSFGGCGVEVGAATSRDDWERTVAQALADGDYVVQERVRSIPFPMQKDGEIQDHDVVWGLFAFGERFGGGFLRTAPQTDGAVINVSSGADVIPLFEVACTPSARRSRDIPRRTDDRCGAEPPRPTTCDAG